MRLNIIFSNENKVIKNIFQKENFRIDVFSLPEFLISINENQLPKIRYSFIKFNNLKYTYTADFSGISTALPVNNTYYLGSFYKDKMAYFEVK
ncbi:hypothetical protein QAA01_01610 [Glaesserella parasuis]|uniref:hypothetical protein n=1 Tax=Glaesserella parasuis TaxID=738 RepID=UPI00135E9829|nr:hypothetical protein [Glaesserella parasuis]MCT8545650.1 hypothetical protein [Glaesserella parasuis]MCT8572216.1 hypothetical protein [Glaesserella parasuis]MCT8590935.1 hypothetical protein [Glaesserella parasuis]MCT8688305.1 hypothetical protein [Glaesserella parasuis]MCT8698747.1 hypothetical protein [Glaesserella parasuis]